MVAVKRKVNKMGAEERYAFIELARGDMYKHMFYTARNGSAAHSATGEQNPHPILT